MTEEAQLSSDALEIELKITAARKRKGMTQEQLTAAIGEKWPSTVSRAVKGDPSPKSAKVRKKIYRVLGL